MNYKIEPGIKKGPQTDASALRAGLCSYQSFLRISFSAVPILIGLPYRSVPMRYSFAPNTPVPMMDNTSIRKDTTIYHAATLPLATRDKMVL